MRNLPWGAILGFLIVGAIGLPLSTNGEELLVVPALFGAFGMPFGSGFDVVRKGGSMPDVVLRAGAGFLGMVGAAALVMHFRLAPRETFGLIVAIGCALSLGLHAWISNGELGPLASLLATLTVG